MITTAPPGDGGGRRAQRPVDGRGSRGGASTRSCRCHGLSTGRRPPRRWRAWTGIGQAFWLADDVGTGDDERLVATLRSLGDLTVMSAGGPAALALLEPDLRNGRLVLRAQRAGEVGRRAAWIAAEGRRRRSAGAHRAVLRARHGAGGSGARHALGDTQPDRPADDRGRDDRGGGHASRSPLETPSGRGGLRRRSRGAGVAAVARILSGTGAGKRGRAARGDARAAARQAACGHRARGHRNRTGHATAAPGSLDRGGRRPGALRRARLLAPERRPRAGRTARPRPCSRRRHELDARAAHRAFRAGVALRRADAAGRCPDRPAGACRTLRGSGRPDLGPSGRRHAAGHRAAAGRGLARARSTRRPTPSGPTCRCPGCSRR